MTVVKKSARPPCRWCGKPMSMTYRHTQDYWNHDLRRHMKEKLGEAGFQAWEKEQKYATGIYGRDGYFCSLSCGSRWAVRELKRREGK